MGRGGGGEKGRIEGEMGREGSRKKSELRGEGGGDVVTRIGRKGSD